MQRCEWMFCELRIHSAGFNGNEHPMHQSQQQIRSTFSFGEGDITTPPQISKQANTAFCFLLFFSSLGDF